MKWLITASLLFSPVVYSQNDQQVLYKKHRMEKHEENKKWEVTKAECHSKYPSRRDVKHADYDAHFKCMETIQDAQIAFEEKQDLESLSKELERRAIIAEAALKRARLNYSIAVGQLQKDRSCNNVY